MVMNEVVGRFMAENLEASETAVNLLSVSLRPPAHVIGALLLMGDHAEHVTGRTLPVDAGFNAR